MKAINRIGKKYGRLTVIRKVPNKGRDRMYRCLCSCGNVVEVSSGHLGSGHTKSCGCLARERASKASTKHGKSKTRTYRIWQNMISRCYNQKIEAFKSYGLLGTKVCDRWRTNFSNFYNDMGPAPKGCSIDRIDTRESYKPSNCRWASSGIQARNRKRKQTNTSSPYKGVFWHRASGKFCAKCCVNYREYWLGLSDDPEELARKYDSKIIQLTGSDEGTNKALGYID